ncbi:MAG: hypothetical protein Q8M26_05945 [Pseudolabrys sp.]|nr:hypothetical protein [Pseudolabrys sp.]
MSHVDDKPIDPEAAAVFAKLRRLMLIAGATTFIALAGVIGAIGYRVFTAGGRAPPVTAEAVAPLPGGARVLSSAVGDGRVVLTVEIGGVIELRSFDLGTLKPVGRQRLGE